MTSRTPRKSDPVEVVPAVVQSTDAPVGVAEAVPATVTPTQVRRPWRSTVRTVWQALLGLCVLAPILVEVAGLDPAKLPYLGTVLVVAAAITRVMAVPAVETWLRRFLPFLAAAPPPGD